MITVINELAQLRIRQFTDFANSFAAEESQKTIKMAFTLKSVRPNQIDKYQLSSADFA